MQPVPLADRAFVKIFRFLSKSTLVVNGTGKFPPDETRQIDTSAGKTRVLVFKPKAPVGGPLPCCVDIHGSGFVALSADYDNPLSRWLADELGCLVISIDYRLAPEYRFPVALEESYDVVKWIWEHAAELGIDRSRIALCGHSAGGNLAAGITLLARERKEFSICYQILDYPPLDLTRDPAEKTRVPPGSKVLPPGLARIFDRCYIGSHEDARNPLVSPVCATDLKGLPPALVITAEQDSLAEEAERYADMLAAAGVPVVKKMFVGATHGFTLYPGELAQQAWVLMKQELGKAFAC